VPSAQVNDLTMYYEELGPTGGTPLVLLHGAGGTIDDQVGGWAGLAPSFADSLRVILVEHRGHGRTDNPAGSMTFEQIADDVAALLEHLGLGSVHVAGISDGAVVALDLALRRPRLTRTIVVLGEPLHPRRDDALPWELLAGCDAVYFTAQDPELLKAARAARRLVVSARRRAALVASGVRADVVVGSAHDGREASTLADYPVTPEHLVMTEGAAGGRVESARDASRFAPGRAPPAMRSSYGAGDSFAGALVYYLAAGLPIVAACAEAAHHGAAVLAGNDPLAAQLPLRRGAPPGP